MVEPELVGNLGQVMDLAEAYVKALIEAVPPLPSLARDPRLEEWTARPFVRVTYSEAIDLLVPQFRDVKWGDDLGSAQEKWLADHFGGPTFVTHYPAKIKAFYMRATRDTGHGGHGDHKTVEAFDLLVPDLGELIGGSAREEDYGRLLGRIREEGLDPEDYKAYLDLRRFGSMPHGGFGLGFERFVSWVSGVGHLREVTPYVRAYGCPL
jgi:asparaginyl-tRNA synthetase